MKFPIDAQLPRRLAYFLSEKIVLLRIFFTFLQQLMKRIPGHIRNLL